ncbi:MAG TPA: hypothetical protein PKV21_04630 [bacterium]|nr:hypothetical protein [bacterium]HOM26774.1 hypothetical protein [bacterium]
MGKKLFFLILTGFLSSVFSQNKKLEEASLNILFNFTAEKYEEVFNSFYLPENYDEKNFKNDKEAITKGLEFIIEKLGDIRNFSKVNSTEKEIIALSLKTGPFEEIENLKSYLSIYKVNFEKFGNAYISFEFIEKKEEYFLKKIEFLFPIQNNKSLSINKEIQQFFIDLALKQKKTDKE